MLNYTAPRKLCLPASSYPNPETPKLPQLGARGANFPQLGSTTQDLAAGSFPWDWEIPLSA